MSTKPKVIIRHIIAVIKMPKRTLEKIVKAEFIKRKLNNNDYFPSPYPGNIVTYDQFVLHLSAFSAAQAAVLNRVIGAVEARDAALSVVIADLRNLLTMVQNVADANPANSEAIIAGAGYDVKRITVRQKQQNGAKNTRISGTVMITADATRGHEWQMTKDQIAITHLPATSAAHTLVSNLTPGDVWFFRNHKIGKQGEQFGWSDWFRLMVN